ncbi:UPF0389 protein CG9231 [Wyeomyia smithii]|uniref:UPF0389 protein CG9231 n=1 Tax=Wyeomyia smithii TaxID=174621 RepID=UPI002467C943|nr:UPF0389 protein CG9231 [Wyeomyia smithii]XP_055530536.1 UPF0389 protein CG9231 [Wyeomyia smithii]
MSFIGACGLARIATVNGSRQVRLIAARSQQLGSYSTSSIEPKEPPKNSQTPSEARSATTNLSSQTHAPNNLEKKMLVFTKKYKSVDEIPSFVNQDVMERCRNQVRIKLANYLMLATAIGCLIMIVSGKKAQERGESVQKMNLDWHKEYNEKARQEAAQSKN